MTELDEEDVPQRERIRSCAHRDVQRVCAAWEPALLDARARGFGSGRSYDGAPRGGGELTAVEAAAIRPDFATAWIAELGDVLVEFLCPDVGVYSMQTRIAVFHDQVDELMDSANHRVWNHATLRLRRLAASADAHWPERPQKGQVVGGVTVGERGNVSQVCVECGDPVVSGRDEHGQPLLRSDKDGNAFHGAGPGCYWTWRRRKAKEAKAAAK